MQIGKGVSQRQHSEKCHFLYFFERPYNSSALPCRLWLLFKFERKPVTLRFGLPWGIRSRHSETYTVHLRHIRKFVVNLLLVLIKLFFARCYGWGATSENWLKIGVFQRDGLVAAKFSRSRGRLPQTIFAWIVRPINALQLWQFSHKQL